jgi:hypothetical protein
MGRFALRSPASSLKSVTLVLVRQVNQRNFVVKNRSEIKAELKAAFEDEGITGPDGTLLSKTEEIIQKKNPSYRIVYPKGEKPKISRFVET